MHITALMLVVNEAAWVDRVVRWHCGEYDALIVVDGATELGYAAGLGDTTCSDDGTAEILVGLAQQGMIEKVVFSGCLWKSKPDMYNSVLGMIHPETTHLFLQGVDEFWPKGTIRALAQEMSDLGARCARCYREEWEGLGLDDPFRRKAVLVPQSDQAQIDHTPMDWSYERMYSWSAGMRFARSDKYRNPMVLENADGSRVTGDVAYSDKLARNIVVERRPGIQHFGWCRSCDRLAAKQKYYSLRGY